VPSQHKRVPLSVRLPEGDEEWLRMHAEYTGQPVNALLRLAVADLRARVTDDVAQAMLAQAAPTGLPHSRPELSRHKTSG